MDETILITKYIAAWSWQIIAIIFLNTAFVLVISNHNYLAISFSVIFFVCELMSFKRQKELIQNDKTNDRKKTE